MPPFLFIDFKHFVIKLLNFKTKLHTIMSVDTLIFVYRLRVMKDNLKIAVINSLY